MKVTRQQLEDLIERYAEASFNDGYAVGQSYPFYSNPDSLEVSHKLNFLLDLLFNPPAAPVRQRVGSWEAEIQAQCLLNDGISACYMCGLPASECDKIAQESGYDECEDLAR